MIKTENFKIREIVDILTNSLWPDLTDEIRLENQDVCFKITLLKYCPFPNGNTLCITEYIDKESLDKMFELAVPAMAKSIIDRWKRSLEHEFFLYKEKHATVAQLYDALKEVGDDIGHWMLTPNNYIFNGLTPVQVIERGDIKLIWDLVYQLRSGMPQ